MEQYIIYGLGVLLAVLGYLLKRADDSQQAQINLLFKKHDDDAKALSDLQLTIAKEHYLKHELDQRFSTIDTTLREGFKDMGEKFDRLSAALLDHILKEESRNDRRGS